MADWLDDPELYKPAKAPKSGGDDWLDDPALYAEESPGFLKTLGSQIATEWDKGLIANVREMPGEVVGLGESLARGVGSGLSRLGGTAALIGGMPVAVGVDAIARAGGQPTGYTDAVGRYVDDSYAYGDRLLRDDPNAAAIPNQITSALGGIAPDLAMALMTGGESAVVQPLVQGTVRQGVARATEQMIEQGAKASIVPSIERGSELGTDVLQAGGSLGEAFGAAGTGAAGTTAAYLLPGAATGRLPVRAVEGAVVEPLGGYLQNQAENAVLDDRLGLDQEYDARQAFMDAFLGGGLAVGMGGRPPEALRDPEAMRTPEDIASAEIETALDDETFAQRPAPPVAERPSLGEALAPEVIAEPPVAAQDVDAPFRRPVEAPAVEVAAVAPDIAPDAGTGIPVSPPEPPAAERLYADYNPEASQTVTRVDGNLSFPESRLTRRALDDALSDPDPVNAAERLLTNLADQPDIRDEQRWLANKLAPLMRDLGVKLSAPNPDLPHAGAYSNTENTVWVRQADPETVLHETFHGATSALITSKAARSNPVVGKAVTELDDMRGHLTGGIGLGDIDTSSVHPEVRRLLGDKQGPLSNTKEFVTYGMTNRPFQDFLKSLPPPPGREKARNMWEYFKSVVTSMFGAKTDAQRSFLDALIESGADLVEFAAANPKATRVAQAAEAGKFARADTPTVVPPAKPPAPKPETPPSRPPTSLKNESVAAVREQRGDEPVEKDAPQSNDTTLDKAKAELKRNPDAAQEIIERMAQSPQGAVSVTEQAILLVESERVRAEREKAEERAADLSLTPEQRAVALRKVEDMNAAVTTLDQATTNVGTIGGRLLQFRQRALKEDFTLAALERKATAVKGAALTADERAELKDLARRFAEKEKEFAALQEKLAERATNQDVAATYRKLLEDLQKPRRPDVAALRKKAEAGRKALRELAGTDAAVMTDAATLSPEQALIDIGAFHYASGATTVDAWMKAMKEDVPEQFRKGLEDLFALSQAGASRPVMDGPLTHKQVYDLAMAQVKSGVKGEDAVMKAVTADVKKAHPDMTERDVRRLFSEYGKVAFPSKDADKTALRELRALVQMQESIDRLQEGLPKLKSGPQRDKATALILEKRAALNVLLKAGHKKVIGDADRLKMYQDARAENLRKQIELIDRQVMTGERTGERVAKPVTPEIERLSALRDQLRAEREAIDNPPKSEQQVREESRIRALESNIQRIRDSLSGKPAEPGNPPVSSDQIKSLEKLRDELRDQLKAANAVKNPPMSDAEKQQRRIESGLKRRINNVEDLLLFGKKPKPTPVEKGEAALLLEKALEAFTDIRDAIDLRDNPPLTADQRYQKARGNAIKRQIEKLRARILANDYEKSVRVPKELNEANTKAAFELEKIKEQFLRFQFEQEMAKRTKLEKLADIGKNVISLPQPMMTSLDLSALLRQGYLIAASRPFIAFKVLPVMFRAFRSAEKAAAVEHRIKNSPNYRLVKPAGLELTTDNPLAKLSDMEEKFRSRWIEKFETKEGEDVKNALRTGKNIATAHVRASNRAFVATLNSMRMMAFDALIKTWTVDPANPTLPELKAIARYINIATGRGEIPGSKGQGPGFIANAAIFAPRLLASRFNMLYGLPYAGGTAKTKRMVAAEYARIWAGTAVIVALARGLWELQDDEDKKDPFIETDVRSTNFGKMKFGDTYVDPMAGFAQTTTFLARIASGESKTQAGDIIPLREDYRPMNFLRDDPMHDEPLFGYGDAANEYWRFLRTKMAPWPGAVVSFSSGKDPIGNKVTPTSLTMGLLTPLSAGDIVEIMEANGIPKATALTMAAIFGMGVQNRDPASRAPGFSGMSREDKDVYGSYVKEAQKIKKAKQSLQDFANGLPTETAPADMRYEVEKKAAELGLEGATVDIYKANTPTRDKETGQRMRGVKRTETGNVKMNYKEAWSLKGYSAAEKSVTELDNYIEELDDDSLTNADVNKIWGKFVFSDPLTTGAPDATASDKDKDELLKVLRAQRKLSQSDFVRNQQ